MDTKHSILYLDDEEQNLIAFQALLRKDYKVFTTTDAHEATEILSRENIAVIFSDQKMPEVSGVEFFENIIHEYPTPVRILLTGHADIEAVIDAINKGQVYRYVSKPWEVGDLKICIENAVEKFERDVDLQIKKSSLQQVQSENAMASSFNYLYQMITTRLVEHAAKDDKNSLLRKIRTQQQIAALHELFKEDESATINESQGKQSTFDWILDIIKSCESINAENASIELKSSNESDHQFEESRKILAVVLIMIHLTVTDENVITPHIEVIENQEKSIVKMQLIPTLNLSEFQLRQIELFIENLRNYLKKNRGSIQLDTTTDQAIRITFEIPHI